jgi:hypothetical protein
MKQVFRGSKWNSFTVLGVAVILTALALTGCGRNEGALPAGYAPEGVTGEETLLFVVVDSIPGNSVSPPGPAVTVTVIDRTNADGFQIYRRVDGSDAFDQAVGYAAPFGTTFNQAVQYFQAIDRDWKENRGVDYVGRATIRGHESKASPLSGAARVPAGTFAELRPAPMEWTDPIDTLSVDSLLILRGNPDPQGAALPLGGFEWEAVPGAVRYLVTCIRTDGVGFLTILTPPDGSTTLDLTDLTGTLELQTTLPLSPSSFFWTVDALDADNRAIASTPGLQIFQVVPRCALFPNVPCPD